MIIKPSLTLVHSILLALQMSGLNRARLLTLLSTFVGMHAVLDTYSCMLPHLKGLQVGVPHLHPLMIFITDASASCKD